MQSLSWSEIVEKTRDFQESRVLLTGIELDVFTAVGDGALAGQMAARIGADLRSATMLLDALVAIGALIKRNDVYFNTADTARFLVAESPDYQRPGLMHRVNLWRTWSTLTEAVRAGTAVEIPGVERRDDENWTTNFISAMHSIATRAALEMLRVCDAGDVRRMLDVGGGSGAVSIAFARTNPELRAEVLDQPAVVALADRYIAEAGLSDRVTAKVGDLMRDDLGEGYNLVVLSAICHMLSPAENRDLFRRSYRALNHGGRVLIREFIVGPDRTAPKQAALFALNMLVGTRAGSTYTEQEYREWLLEAGFQRVDRPVADGDFLIGWR